MHRHSDGKNCCTIETCSDLKEFVFEWTKMTNNRHLKTTLGPRRSIYTLFLPNV